MEFTIKDSSLIEIARSFSFKKNIGNYESADFFCSAKKQCKPEDAEETSRKLYDFCKAQVQKDIKTFLPEPAKVGADVTGLAAAGLIPVSAATIDRIRKPGPETFTAKK